VRQEDGDWTAAARVLARVTQVLGQAFDGPVSHVAHLVAARRALVQLRFTPQANQVTSSALMNGRDDGFQAYWTFNVSQQTIVKQVQLLGQPLCFRLIGWSRGGTDCSCPV